MLPEVRVADAERARVELRVETLALLCAVVLEGLEGRALQHEDAEDVQPGHGAHADVAEAPGRTRGGDGAVGHGHEDQGLQEALDIGRIVAGLVLLVLGGEFLVRGASPLAGRFGISSLVIGLTVVSAATSAPEFAVSVGAVLRDEPGLAVGNAVGSNIINVLLILGLSALVVPLAVKRRLIRFDLPLMVALQHQI